MISPDSYPDIVQFNLTQINQTLLSIKPSMTTLKINEQRKVSK